jgi:hypothetical protein
MRISRLALLIGCLLPLSGCATMQQIRALENVDFSIDGVGQVSLAGINLADFRAFTDLSFTDGARFANAVRTGDVPLSMVVNVLAENPTSNYADARLIRMDWSLLLQDRETVNGRIVTEMQLPRGEPIVVQLNLVEFFEGNARDLFELALSFTGMGGEAKDVKVRALPVVDTAFGPITYDQPIVIVSAEVGRSSSP